jgi:thiol-disulfide isomerase/thioredoxin
MVTVRATRVAPLAAIVALGTVCVGPLAAQLENQVGIARGTIPPTVEMEDLNGEVVDLAGFVGHGPVLLQFWARWCDICEALAPTMEAAHGRFGDRVTFLVVAVGVNQSPRSIRRHLERHPVTGRLLWDGEGRATRAYQAPTTGYIVILDAEGLVAYTGVGEDQDIEAALERILQE